jgi:nucleoside 2-deoxyribosyltransferase
MTGLPGQNYAAFQAAAERLRAQGVQVISPHEITPPGVGPWTWEAHMRVDLAELLRADVIVLLPGWETSRGALLEKTVAEAIGMPVDYTLTETS